MKDFLSRALPGEPHQASEGKNVVLSWGLLPQHPLLEEATTQAEKERI